MKSLLIRIIVISFLLVLSVSDFASAETKTFIKEYTYQASDLDSKVSSRTIALEQVKRLLLEEVGVYLTSETEVKDFQLTKDKISTLSAGVVQTEILDEKWDGRTYYLKARVSIDRRDTAKLLAGLKDNRQKNQELEETNRKVDEALKKIKELQDERVKGQPSASKQNEYSKAVAELKSKEWVDKGMALMNAENYVEALDAFTRATEIDPANVWARIDRGWALYTLGDCYQALKEYDRAAEIDPRNPWIYVNKAMAHNQLGEFQQGLVEANKAIHLDSKIAWAYIGRGWAYSGLGNYGQAIAELDKASQLEPGNSFVYSTRAWSYVALGNTRQALADLDRSIDLAPNSSWMHWNAAVFYAVTGDKGKAIAALEKAIRLNSTIKQRAKSDKNLQSLWYDPNFKRLVD